MAGRTTKADRHFDPDVARFAAWNVMWGYEAALKMQDEGEDLPDDLLQFLEAVTNAGNGYLDSFKSQKRTLDIYENIYEPLVEIYRGISPTEPKIAQIDKIREVIRAFTQPDDLEKYSQLLAVDWHVVKGDGAAKVAGLKIREVFSTEETRTLKKRARAKYLNDGPINFSGLNWMLEPFVEESAIQAAIEKLDSGRALVETTK